MSTTICVDCGDAIDGGDYCDDCNNLTRAESHIRTCRQCGNQRRVSDHYSGTSYCRQCAGVMKK